MRRGRGLLRSTVTNVLLAIGGLALGAIGLGWHGRPSDAAIIKAIRGRAPAHARATITLRQVDRNWVHEVWGTSASEFLVTAIVTPPGGSAVEGCYDVEPSLAGTAIAFGPYEAWRCRYPF